MLVSILVMGQGKVETWLLVPASTYETCVAGGGEFFLHYVSVVLIYIFEVRDWTSFVCWSVNRKWARRKRKNHEHSCETLVLVLLLWRFLRDCNKRIWMASIVTQPGSWVVLLVVLCGIFPACEAKCYKQDGEALLAFKDQFLDYNNVLTTWNSTTDCCLYQVLERFVISITALCSLRRSRLIRSCS